MTDRKELERQYFIENQVRVNLPTAHDAEIHNELRKGIMPCRFCGLDWFWDGNRHDPLRLAGVSTLRGQACHNNRALRVAFGNLARSLWETPIGRWFR